MGSWSVIVGRAGTDKARVALHVARSLASRGLRVGGFVQEEVLDAEGETLGWDLVSVTDGARVKLARVGSEPTMCGYRFEERSFEQVRAWGRAAADVVVIGGVGKLEAAERGHWPLLASLVRDAEAPHVVAGVRDTSLATIALALPDPESFVELPCDQATLTAFVAGVAEVARLRRCGG